MLLVSEGKRQNENVLPNRFLFTHSKLSLHVTHVCSHIHPYHMHTHAHAICCVSAPTCDPIPPFSSLMERWGWLQSQACLCYIRLPSWLFPQSSKFLNNTQYKLSLQCPISVIQLKIHTSADNADVPFIQQIFFEAPLRSRPGLTITN